MGKKIDRFAFTSILAVFLFVYFYSAFKNTIVSVLLSLLCCVLLEKLYQRFRKSLSNASWHRKRELRRKSNSALMHLACMEKAEACGLISSLIKTCYHTDEYIELEQIHPSLQISPNRIFEYWRKHRDLSELIICTTGSCSSDARIMAESLKHPKVAVVDAAILSQLISEHPCGFYPPAEEKKKYKLQLKRLGSLIFNRKNAPRCILFSFSMMTMYIFSGRLFYLVFSLFLLFVALLSLRQPVRPAKLF